MAVALFTLLWSSGCTVDGCMGGATVTVDNQGDTVVTVESTIELGVSAVLEPGQSTAVADSLAFGGQSLGPPLSTIRISDARRTLYDGPVTSPPFELREFVNGACSIADYTYVVTP